jgi:hypothetical protein
LMLLDVGARGRHEGGRRLLYQEGYIKRLELHTTKMSKQTSTSHARGSSQCTV